MEKEVRIRLVFFSYFLPLMELDWRSCVIVTWSEGDQLVTNQQCLILEHYNTTLIYLCSFFFSFISSQQSLYMSSLITKKPMYLCLLNLLSHTSYISIIPILIKQNGGRKFFMDLTKVLQICIRIFK